MQHVFSIPDAAAQIGIPMRTLYRHLRHGLIPCERLSPHRRVMTADQVSEVRRVYRRYGSEGLRRGYALEAAFL